MGFEIRIKGKKEEIFLKQDNILAVKFLSDTPNDSNARTSDLSIGIEVKGKIITPVNGEEADHTKQVGKWSLIPAESSDAYRAMNLKVISGSVVVREIDFSNAFIVDYVEDYTDKEGVGEYILTMKQKKEKLEEVKFEGGYASSEE
ncbi:MAG: membrane-associated protease 1 [Fusobacteriaceae bacterium]